MASDIISIALPRDELNRNLGGGIPSNSLVLIEGPDGAGKSVLSQRFCYAFLENGKTVTYISTELNTKDFLAQMKSLDYDVKFYLLEGKLLFIPMFPFIGNSKLADNFLDKLFQSTQLFENEIIIIDTLSFLLVSDKLSESKAFDVMNILKKLTSLNKTIFISVDPMHVNKQFLTLLRSVADIYLSLELKEFAGGIVRIININRFKRPADTFIPAIPFKVEPGKGLIIEIASFD
ncbi:hypothetical protein D6764_04505 [Candidatus Woesearchaeota archaeon]|nr:MAG: hypothetical protein D6764_04505 [Candidatus Woesearchaeota archaeon]